MPASGACLYFSGGGKSTVDNTVSNQKQLCHHSGEATFKSQFKPALLAAGKLMPEYRNPTMCC